MECDVLLLSGTCVVNESMLTGECTPVTKNCLSDEPGAHSYYSTKNDASHTLFCGTKILLTRSSAVIFPKY